MQFLRSNSGRPPGLWRLHHRRLHIHSCGFAYAVQGPSINVRRWWPAGAVEPTQSRTSLISTSISNNVPATFADPHLPFTQRDQFPDNITKNLNVTTQKHQACSNTVPASLNDLDLMPEKKDKNVKRKVRFSEDDVDMPRAAVASLGAATSLANLPSAVSLLKSMNSKLDNQAVITQGFQNEVMGLKGDLTAVRNDVDHVKESQQSLRKVVDDQQKAVDTTLKHFKKEMDDALTRSAFSFSAQRHPRLLAHESHPPSTVSQVVDLSSVDSDSEAAVNAIIDVYNCAMNSPTGMCDPDEDFHSDLEFDEDPDEFGGMEIDDGDYPVPLCMDEDIERFKFRFRQRYGDEEFEKLGGLP